ncbi:twin-arginine translocase TatA/TatE family subunit [Leptospira sp. GIMC2001]|nr:twin-arginine translocase TatA/TatE family subunit [Leptospira sp. GIMC2001]WCL51379.1 twin-arginine translocase TatA/TatE family subunit [Leptospira sp. GIMC2001]
MTFPLGFLNLGPWEIALILFLALLLFGGKKLPGLAKDLGEGIKEFRRSLSGNSDDDHRTEIAQPKIEESAISTQAKSNSKKASAKTKKKA